MESNNPSKQDGRGWWPSVETESAAKGAAHQGAAAAVFVACVGGLFSILAMFGVQILPGPRFSPFAIVDAALFAIVGWRIYRMSRAWAVFGLRGFVSERVYSFYTRGFPATAGLVVGLVVLLGFINGVRGTFAFHKFAANETVPHDAMTTD